ncbi:hypothetical protein TRAPUB_5416 [Trametes pubescens]|uniref:DUF6535 domain-containing protein n=1 Tax=Trametes pubescens TaxID=154538 RepID=A0A1M2V8J9_TRAPU|nr:hypothetical protein TRAPUB_5416 [Trametes pubescens]
MSDPTEEGPPSLGAPTLPPAANNAKPSVGKISAGADVSVAIPDRVTIEDVHKTCKEVYTETEKTTAWTDVAVMVEKYSDKMIDQWIKEIDTNLVLISSKLDSFSINHPFVNTTQPSSTNCPNTDTAVPILRWAVWLNRLWFSGLILSLTAASIGLLSKQWLNEYSSGVFETSRHAARVRQYHLENIKAWHVDAVVDSIPVLLMISLVCFLAGLLIFLWNLHHTVAAIASVLVGMLAVFSIVVTLLPLWKPKCAYLSPQIRMIYHIWRPE